MNDVRIPERRAISQRMVSLYEELHSKYIFATREALIDAAVSLIKLENMTHHPSYSGTSPEIEEHRQKNIRRP